MTCAADHALSENLPSLAPKFGYLTYILETFVLWGDNELPFKKLTIAATIGAVGLITTAYAAGHLTQEQQRAIEVRQSHMKLFGHNLGPLGAMAQDKMPYDAAVASAAATNLAALAGMDQAGYWLDGTDSSVEGNRAKAEIWTDAAGFEAEAAKLADAASALAMVAGDGADAMKAAFGPVGQACGSCHESYRTPRN